MSQRTARSRLDQFQELSTLRITYLKYIGLWAVDSDSSALLKCLYFAYNKFILTIMLVFMVTLLADICSSLDDLSIVTDDGCIFAGIVVVFFKVMIFQTRREQIVRLLRETIDGCDQLCKFPVGDEGEILGKYLLLSRVTFYGFSTLAVFLVIALLFLVPVEDGELPVRALYPFDTTKYPWHAVGFFVEACTVSIGMTAIIGMDSLHINLCNLFLVHLGILNEHFKSCSSNRIERDDLGARFKISSSTVEERNREKDNYDPDEIRRGSGNVFVERFRRSIRNHQRLLAIIDDFNKVVGQSSNICKFSIYLAAAVSQLFYICWIGNEVIYQSALLTQSQWLSGWSDELSSKTGRLINLSMIFTKKTLNLKAGVFYVLSMETFIAILKSSYSFFTLLTTMQLEND